MSLLLLFAGAQLPYQAPDPFAKRPSGKREEEYTLDDLKRLQKQIKEARERAENARKDKIAAEEKRLAELLAIYARITGEELPDAPEAPVAAARIEQEKPKAKGLVLKALKQFRAENDEAERRVLAVLGHQLEQLEARALRYQQELEDEEAFLLMDF